MLESGGERPRFELSEVLDDGSSRAEVCSLRDVVGRVGDVALSRRSLWGLSVLVGGGLLAACAPASGSGPSATPSVAPTDAPAVTATRWPVVQAMTTTPTTVSRIAASSPVVSTGAACNDRLAHGGPVLAVALSPDGTLVASAGVAVSGEAAFDCAVKLWRAADGALLQTLKGKSGGIVALAFSPDGQTVAAGWSDGSLSLWRTTGGPARELRWSPPNVAFIAALAFSPDGKTLAAANLQGQVGLWEPATGNWKRALADGTLNGLFSLAFSPDGQTLAVGTIVPGIVRFWNVADGVRRSEQSIDEIVLSLAWSPDGRRIAVGGVKKVYLLDATTGESTGAIDLAGTEPGANSLAFAKDSASVFVGRGDGGLSVADVGGGTPSVVAAHSAGTTKLALDGAGKLLVTSGGDGRIRLWDTSTTVKLIDRCFGDSTLPTASQLGTVYATDANGVKRTYNVACGAPIPKGANCTCNCVPGVQAGLTPVAVATPIPVATVVSRSPVPVPKPGGSVPGGSYCTCNKVCTCVPVRKYCFVMWR